MGRSIFLVFFCLYVCCGLGWVRSWIMDRWEFRVFCVGSCEGWVRVSMIVFGYMGVRRGFLIRVCLGFFNGVFKNFLNDFVGRLSCGRYFLFWGFVVFFFRFIFNIWLNIFKSFYYILSRVVVVVRVDVVYGGFGFGGVVFGLRFKFTGNGISVIIMNLDSIYMMFWL